MFKYGGFGIIRAMNIKFLQYGMIARVKEILLPPVLRMAGMRGFVASRGAKAPGHTGKDEGVLGRAAACG